MKRTLYVVMAVLLVSSCGCYRNCPYKDAVQVRDSVAVTTVTRYIDSTIYYRVADSVSVISTRDTTSHLETDMAESDVAFSGGILTHSLRNKEQLIPIEITLPAEEKTVYKERIVTVEKEVEKGLTWWQQTLIRLGYAFIAAVGLFAIFKFVKSKI